MIELLIVEQRLRAARPDVEGSTPSLPALLARIEQQPALPGPRASRSSLGLVRTRVAVCALAGALLVATGGTAAALLLSTGAPVQPTYVLPATPEAGLGETIPSSLALLPMRVADPEGGPPWAMRVLRTTRGLLCLQAGRVVNGQLGGLGSGYAFGGDQRFHPFLAEDAVATDSCPAVGVKGDAFLPGPPIIVPANALPLAGENVAAADQVHCDLPGQENWGVRCPERELRQVAFGLLGPHATAIEVRTPRRSFTLQPYGPLGAYLIVLPAQAGANTGLSSGAYQSPFGYVSHAPGSAALTVSYDDGTNCQIPFTGSGRQCRAHNRGSATMPSASDLNATVQASYEQQLQHTQTPLLVQDASGATNSPSPAGGAAPGVAVSFRSPVAIAGAASGYAVELRPQPLAGCSGPALIVSQPTGQTLAAGAEVQISVPLAGGCASHYSGRVFYASSSSVGGESGGEGPLYEAIASHFRPGAPGREGSLPTVGRFELTVP